MRLCLTSIHNINTNNEYWFSNKKIIFGYLDSDSVVHMNVSNGLDQRQT